MQGGLEEENKKSIKQIISEAFETNASPKDFLNIKKSAIPVNVEEAKHRISTNMSRFRGFYVTVGLIFLSIYFIFKPSVVLLFGILGVGIYLHKTNLKIYNVEFTPRLVNIIIGTLLVFFFIFSREVVVGLLALLMFISILVLTHAILMKEEAEEEEAEEEV